MFIQMEKYKFIQNTSTLILFSTLMAAGSTTIVSVRWSGVHGANTNMFQCGKAHSQHLFTHSCVFVCVYRLRVQGLGLYNQDHHE